ncbi:MAG TPA: PLP-dependent aminotransferase family protein [Vicinamibacterales bacterium]|nr:PLP-dependent aminotransferase family protein [Vicinamibacterales bacterium]
MKRTTSPTELLLEIDRATSVPLRVQLERELRRAIQAGRLKAGAPLPSTRSLAADLDVSRGVVVEAYEQLLAEGYVRTHHGSATHVAGRRTIDREPPPKEVAPLTPRYDFRPGVPDLSLFPRRAWVAALRRAFASLPDVALDYPDPRGAAPARRALANYLNRARATVAREDRVVFCNGSAQGIGLLCRVLRERGVRRIAVEDPGYADQCTNIQACGLETPRVPVDDRGLCVDRLGRLDAGAVLVTPAHQYPTGAVLAPERRAALLEWAATQRTIIIEDDYDAEYRYDREPIGALQGLAPERVVYAGSASKVLSPALRLGWLVVPPDLVVDITRAKLQADNGSATPEQLALAEFIESGALDSHLRRTRHIYRRRRDALVTSLHKHLPNLRLHGVAAGLHVLIELAGGVDERAVVETAARRSIRVYGGGDYRAKSRAGPPAILVGYGGLPESTIPEAVRELAQVLTECGQPRSSSKTRR